MLRNAVANRWAFVPLILLGSTVANAFLMVSLSAGDGNGTAAEPDYYRKAAAWDSVMQQRLENGYLNWVVTPAIVAGKDDPLKARLELAIADKHGISIAGAHVTAEAIPIRDADRRVALELSETAAGLYGCDIPLQASGLWEFRVRVEARDSVYTDCVRRQINFRQGRSGA